MPFKKQTRTLVDQHNYQVFKKVTWAWTHKHHLTWYALSFKDHFTAIINVYVQHANYTSLMLRLNLKRHSTKELGNNVSHVTWQVHPTSEG